MAHPFFIVGSARSGTTLLRLILNAHSEVAVPPESRFVVELYRGKDTVDVEAFLQQLCDHKRFATWDLPISLVRDELGREGVIPYSDAIRAAFRAYARSHGKEHWGDKTPRYVENIELLNRLFPEAGFIHLIRDGRNVALSYANVPFGPKTVAQAASLWSKRVCAGYTVGRALGGEHYLEVLYEDLVEDPEGVTRDICRFVDLSFDPGMLDYVERARGSVLPRATMYNPHVTEKPRAGVRSWQDSMPAGDVEVFESVAGDVLSVMGYERRFPDPRPSAKIRAGLARAGLPIGKIREVKASSSS